MKKSIPPVVLGSAIAMTVLVLRYREFLDGQAMFASNEHEFLRTLAAFIHGELIEGRWPIWNPNLSPGGAPVLPDSMPSVFYPFVQLFRLQGYEIAVSLYLIVHQMISWLGACMLAKHLGVKSFRAVALAIALLMVQMLLAQDSNLALAAGVSWLIWFIWALLRGEGLPARAKRTPPHWASSIVLYSIFFALIVLSGSPLSILLALVATLNVTFISNFVHSGKAKHDDASDGSEHPAHTNNSLPILLASFVLSLGLASPLLFQFWEWEKFTSTNGLNDTSSTGSGHPENYGSAYLINNFKWMESDEELTNNLASPIFDSKKVVLIERSKIEMPDMERLDRVPLLPDNAPTGPPMKAIEIEDEKVEFSEVPLDQRHSQHVAISIKATSPAFLILCENFYPGWKASIDSIPVPNYRANRFARAVYVREGSHLVAFDYRPDFMKVGANIVLCALICEIVLIFVWSWKLLGKLVRYGSIGKWED